MSPWVTTHGLSAIIDSRSDWTLQADKGSAYIVPRGGSLEGWVHFALPSPPPTHPRAKILALDFHSRGAVVASVEIYLGRSLVLSQGFQQQESFMIGIPPGTVEHGRQGIAVSVYIKFDRHDSNIVFQSVGLELYD